MYQSRLDRTKAATRDTLIFGTPDVEFRGGICHYYDLDAWTLRKLLDDGHAEANDKQNSAPTLLQFLEYLETFGGTAHGYAVSPDRSDYRVSVEGITVTNPTEEARNAFLNLCRDADEFVFTPQLCHCWYD